MSDQEKQERERTMFGCTIAELEAEIKESLSLYVRIERKPGQGLKLLTMSILSDAQEALERHQGEIARLYINKAKYLIMREDDHE